ncbi:hypothetical protein HD554DRAFT_2168219 [Boletus coccyginus]|nr:hypothetical protein HD554DRAFT_2168219 [Boletus coccyginus]
MTPGIFSLFTITFSLSRGFTVRPNILNAVSNATCQPEYGWMNNTEQKDPCLTVAYVIGACVGDTWTQPALPSGYSYNSPNGTTATPCYCSWSCYNLMMACTLCQDPAYTNEITTWPSFSQNCPSNYKDAIFPQGYVIPNNISIPYWATIDPTSWPNELFNIGQAENYSQQSKSPFSHTTELPFIFPQTILTTGPPTRAAQEAAPTLVPSLVAPLVASLVSC